MTPLKDRMFMPGPTEVPPSLLNRLGAPFPHHRTPEFTRLFAETSRRMSSLLGTGGPSFLLASSGTGGMEAAVQNLLSPGDEALVVGGGYFAERWRGILAAFGIPGDLLEVPWGDAVEPAAVARALDAKPHLRAVFMNQSETSTGVVHDVEAVARVIRERRSAAPASGATPGAAAGPGPLLVVDAISALIAQPLRMDAWGVDVVVTASQKGLMLPPGLAVVAVGEAAWPRVEAASLPRFYFDLRRAKQALAKGETPFTPPITLVIALGAALDLIEAEGLEAAHARHARLAAATRAAARAMGLELFAKRPSNVVTAIRLPEGEAGEAIPRRLRERFGSRVAGGQGALKGRIMRIGHVGWYDEADIIGIVSALERVLIDSGFPLQAGDGVLAAQRELAA